MFARYEQGRKIYLKFVNILSKSQSTISGKIIAGAVSNVQSTVGPFWRPSMKFLSVHPNRRCRMVVPLLFCFVICIDLAISVGDCEACCKNPKDCPKRGTLDVLKCCGYVDSYFSTRAYCCPYPSTACYRYDWLYKCHSAGASQPVPEGPQDSAGGHRYIQYYAFFC